MYNIVYFHVFVCKDPSARINCYAVLIIFYVQLRNLRGEVHDIETEMRGMHEAMKMMDRDAVQLKQRLNDTNPHDQHYVTMPFWFTLY